MKREIEGKTPEKPSISDESPKKVVKPGHGFWIGLLLSPRKRKVAVRSAYGVVALSVLIIIGTITYQIFGSAENLPLPKVHTDISTQPLTTFQDSLKIEAPSDATTYPKSTCAKLSASWVKDENTKPGIPANSKESVDWSKFDLSYANGSALWLGESSVTCGAIIDVHASLYNLSALEKLDPSPRTIRVLRIGWYGGAGARIVAESKPLQLKEEKIPRARGDVRLVETNWSKAYSFTVGSNWTPGFYLVATVNQDGVMESGAPLIVRAPLGSSQLALMHSLITWNGYSTFAGYSLYFGPGSTVAKRRSTRARVASFDKPLIGSGGFHMFRDGLPLVQFLERAGLNVDQYSDVDIDQWPSVVKSYNGVILGGHPEYMTRRIFDTLISASNTGINLAFLGANTAFWQTRLVDTKSGIGRRLVMYRFATEDPVSDPRGVTVQFSDKRVNVPSSLLTGESTTGVHVYGDLTVVHMPKWLGLPVTTTLRNFSPASEVESSKVGPATPPNLQTIFGGNMNYRDKAQVGSLRTKTPRMETSWFTTPSGAAVFNAGNSMWSCDLINTCAFSTVDESTLSTLDTVTLKVLTLWQKRGVGAALK